jgi:hypothetical protein
MTYWDDTVEGGGADTSYEPQASDGGYGGDSESSYVQGGGYTDTSKNAYGDYGAYTPQGGSAGSATKSKGRGKSGSESYEKDEWGAKSKSNSFKPNFAVPSLEFRVSIIPAIFSLLFVTVVGMMLTAYMFDNYPEGTFANCCRVSLMTVKCIFKVGYNLYHCRLSEIPQVVFASDYEEEELTDEDLERMKLRPGIERALDVEHRKALRKVGIEMNKIKVSNGAKNGLAAVSNNSQIV